VKFPFATRRWALPVLVDLYRTPEVTSTFRANATTACLRRALPWLSRSNTARAHRLYRSIAQAHWTRSFRSTAGPRLVNAVEKYSAEYDAQRAAYDATMRMSALLVLAAAPVLGMAAAAGAWFLVNRSHESPRPRRDEWGP
jgi:hypothetical protein